jgi:hypothetical protein
MKPSEQKITLGIGTGGGGSVRQRVAKKAGPGPDIYGFAGLLMLVGDWEGSPFVVTRV